MENVISYVVMGVALVILVAICLIIKWILGLRRVVPTNDVHIVRSSNATSVYGTPADNSPEEFKQQFKGNAYYAWPEWMPAIGVVVKVMDLSIFDIDIKGYSAYDKDKVPFRVDLKAFFRIADYIKASSRIGSVEELRKHLIGIMEGAARSVLAKDELPVIMVSRGEYGNQFSNEIKDQLAEWGVAAVKNIELMDIRDVEGENVVKEIMEKKKAVISKESRCAVAENEKLAREAEIASKQEIELREINSKQAVALREEEKKSLVGKRQADVTREVGISTELANQEVQEQKKITTEKEMNVLQVNTVRTAEIAKEKAIIEANAAREQAEVDKKTTVVNEEAAKEKRRIEAEAELVAKENKAKELEVTSAAELVVKENKAKETVVEAEAKAKQVKLDADAKAEQVKLEAAAKAEQIELEGNAEAKVTTVKAEANAKQIELEGAAEADVIASKGAAEAEAESAMQKAKVAGEIDLAKEIGENEGYQTYLIQIQQVKSGQEVGIANAAALEKAGIKMLIQNGDVAEGITGIKDIFGPKGAANLSATLEALGSSEIGQTILKKAGLVKDETSSTTKKSDDVDFEEVK